MGSDALIFFFSMLRFKPAFLLYSLTFIKRFFSPPSLSAIRVMSSAYLKLLKFLPAILIVDCASSSPAFCMMYSAYKLNKQGDYKQPSCTPFLIWNQYVFPCLVLTCFLTCIQVSQGAGKLIWYSQLFKNFPQLVVIHRQIAMRETWVGKIPWNRERLPTPVTWPGEFHDLLVHVVAKSRTWLSDFHFTSSHCQGL